MACSVYLGFKHHALSPKPQNPKPFFTVSSEPSPNHTHTLACSSFLVFLGLYPCKIPSFSAMSTAGGGTCSCANGPCSSTAAAPAVRHRVRSHNCQSIIVDHCSLLLLLMRVHHMQQAFFHLLVINPKPHTLHQLETRALHNKDLTSSIRRSGMHRNQQ